MYLMHYGLVPCNTIDLELTLDHGSAYCRLDNWSPLLWSSVLISNNKVSSNTIELNPKISYSSKKSSEDPI